MPIALLLALAPTSALADAPTADPATTHIVNGEEAKGNAFPAAIAIGFEFQGFRQASCSASLIAPRVLVTAAHCTAEYERQGLPAAQITQFGAAFLGNDVQRADTSVGFDSFRNNGGYEPGSQNIRNDIGIIILDEDVPGVDPIWVNMPGDVDWNIDALVRDGHATVTSVGFGITSSNNQNSGGVKRFAELTIDEVDDQFLYSDAQTNKREAGVCSGDSGGPQYFDPMALPPAVRAAGLEKGLSLRMQQWGIHSFVFVDDFSDGSRGDPCRSASGSTRADAFNNFILSNIERAYGNTDMCAINGYLVDGYCDTWCETPDPDCALDIDADGLVSDEEFAAGDRDGDGELADWEIEKIGAACDSTGGKAAWLPLLGLLGLGLRRRRAV